MFGNLIGGLLKTAANVAVTPVAVVADVVTLGDNKSRSGSYTVDQLNEVVKSIEETVNPNDSNYRR